MYAQSAITIPSHVDSGGCGAGSARAATGGAPSVGRPTRPHLPQAAGGIKVSRADVEDAFHFLDTKGRGKVRMEDLRARLSAFYGDLPAREYQFLLGDRAELTLGDLDALLRDNEITNFDPVAEAFKVYDPEGRGFVEPALLRQVFERLGFGSLRDEDFRLLVESADADGDGRISFDDFRSLVDLYAAACHPPSTYIHARMHIGA